MTGRAADGFPEPDESLLEELYAQSQRAVEELLAEQAARADAIAEYADRQAEALARWLADRDATGE